MKQHTPQACTCTFQRRNRRAPILTLSSSSKPKLKSTLPEPSSCRGRASARLVQGTYPRFNLPQPAALKDGLYNKPKRASFSAMPFYKKRLRLPSADYIGRHICFVTMGTENRAKFFADLPTGRWLLEKLLAVAGEFGFCLHAYCAMPDHLHFLSEGLSDRSDLVKFVDGFKQRTAYEFSKVHKQRLWQRRYYDHILRPSEAVEDAACYIWWNPVRKGLCAEPNSYPLSGSQTIDWTKRSPTPTNWKPPWK